MLQSRHSLLVGLIITTAVVTAALSWAGWRLINQQRDIDRQRAQEQLGTAAESLAATIRGRLAEAGERLSQASANPGGPLPAIPGTAILTLRPDGTVIASAGGLPFVPFVPDAPAVDAVFEEAEALEFARNDLTGAATRYRLLARHSDPVVRVGALARLGRVAEKRGDTDAALRAYSELERAGAVRFKHLPADFVSLYQQRAIAVSRGDTDRVQSLTHTLTRGLDAGAWMLTRDAAAWYRDQLGMQALPAAWALAETLERAWQTMGVPVRSRGQQVFSESDRNVLTMWRTNGSATAMMAAFVDEFLPVAPRDVAYYLADPAGRRIAGEPSIPTGAAPPRVVGDSEYAWVLHASRRRTASSARGSERTIIAMMAAMLVFLWGAMYFMARAIRREASVSRLQSEFVAAVSHEFRSPLTTIRQMTELLETGRVTSDARRQTYYSVLTAEASRLQRLVETLLNFGRMEAGAAHYTLQEIDLAAVVQRVVAGIDPAGLSGTRIVTRGPQHPVFVSADAAALALALRNLVDNALKYSPPGTEIRVEWASDETSAAVRVIDRGIGIPRAEQQAIFEKFVRGRAAIDTNVAGTGVGLSMVQQILRAHGGEVEVQSEVGRGSTFTLLLPMAGRQLAAADSQPVAAR